jgi:hypothetical protein
MSFKASFRALALVASLAGLSACGTSGNQYVSNATLSTVTTNGVQYATLSATVSTANMILPSGAIGIVNPHNPTQDYGTVSFAAGVGAQTTQISLNFDLSELANLPTGLSDPTLPNGLAIPLSGNYSHLATLALGSGGNSKIYFSVDTTTKTAFVGAAFAISQFNAGVDANIFLPFNVGAGVTGVAGVFSGTAANTSGLAVFADASSLLASALAASSSRAWIAAHPAPPAGHVAKSLVAVPQSTSKANTARITDMLNSLSARKARLTLK